nr:hypothetical protein CFP56_12087 [Quercus suber]
MCGPSAVPDHVHEDGEKEHGCGRRRAGVTAEPEQQITHQADDPIIRSDETAILALDSDETPPTGQSGAEEQTIVPDMFDSSLTTTLEVADVNDAASSLDDAHDDPIPSSASQAGISEDRLRALCSRHSLSYQPVRRWPAEPPRKSRRVEKPSKIKMYWNCHECKAVLGRERKCRQCGHARCEHARCDECSKTPAARATQLLAAATHPEKEDGAEEVGSATAPEPKVPVEESPVEKDAGKGKAVEPPATDCETANMPAPDLMAATLEQDDDVDEDACDDLLEQHRRRLALHIRPRTSEELMLRPKVQIIRRCCHVCDQPFLPANRTDCANCGHERCTMCPRWPLKAEKWSMGSPGDEKASPVPTSTVQRVYKKPRLRVRYTCEQCDSVFTERNVCTNCGHGRCKDCRRYPPLRTPTPGSTASAFAAPPLEVHDHHTHHDALAGES